MRNFVEYLKSTKASEHTIRAYVSDVKLFLEYVEKPVEEINFMDGIQYKNFIMESCAESTVNRKLVAIRKYFELLVLCEIVKKNPLEKIESIKQSIPDKEALTEEQIRAMFDAANNKRDKAVFTILVNTGLRVSELINIQIDEWENEDGISILGKGRKIRKVYLCQSCLDAINEYLPKRLNSGCNNLFVGNQGNPLTEKNINTMLKKLARNAGMDDVAEWITPHSCRRTFATIIAENGVSISTLQNAMGHNNINTTMRYVKTHDEAVKDMMIGGIV